MRPHRHFSVHTDDALDTRIVAGWISVLLIAGIVVNVLAAALSSVAP